MNEGANRGPIRSGSCYVIAEVGMNHNGDVDLARRLIDVAADAGANAIKFQNFQTEDFITDRRLTWSYECAGGTITEAQYDMFKRYELTGEKLALAAEHCRARGVDFASTPTSEEGVAECVRLGAAFLKNGSDFLTHLPLVRAMARAGLQTVLSTGMATVAEIDDAVRAFRESGGSDLVLLHCVSLYPAQISTLHLRRVRALERTFGCPVGFSDHSRGIVAATVAAALGAVAIERHFTLDKSLPGPDHRFSADPAELRAMVAALRDATAALGEERLGYDESEAEARRLHRLSCVASRPLAASDILKADDIAFRRPGDGLPPKAADWLVGRKLARAILTGNAIRADDLEMSELAPETQSTLSNELVWEQIYRAGHANRYPWDAVVSFVHHYRPRDRLPQDIAVVEIGCGTAPNLWFAAREGFRVAGIDASETAIAKARERFLKEGLEGDLRVGGFNALPFAAQSFDLAIDRGALTCVSYQSAARAVAEVGRVLKPGGAFFCNLYSEDHTSFRSGRHGPDGLIADMTAGSLVGVGQICFYSREILLGLFLDPAWTVVSLEHVLIEGALARDKTVHAEWRLVARKA